MILINLPRIVKKDMELSFTLLEEKEEVGGGESGLSTNKVLTSFYHEQQHYQGILLKYLISTGKKIHNMEE